MQTNGCLIHQSLKDVQVIMFMKLFFRHYHICRGIRFHHKHSYANVRMFQYQSFEDVLVYEIVILILPNLVKEFVSFFNQNKFDNDFQSNDSIITISSDISPLKQFPVPRCISWYCQFNRFICVWFSSKFPVINEHHANTNNEQY